MSSDFIIDQNDEMDDAEQEYSDYVLCMVKNVGGGLYRFYFQTEDKCNDFYGDDFEQKPAAICPDLVPTEDSYDIVFDAKSSRDDYYTSDHSTIFSMQDSLDRCVALMFDRNEDFTGDKNDKLILKFKDNILDVSDALLKYGFELADDFPVREPGSYIKNVLSQQKSNDDDRLVLCFIRRTSEIKLREGDMKYFYKLYFIRKGRLNEFRQYDDWFCKRQPALFGPFDLDGFQFDDIMEASANNIKLDTIEEQNEYSIQECVDGCVCLASENIDGQEYPEVRIVLSIGDCMDDVESLLWDKQFNC